MTAFWILAVCMLAGALIFILPPLLSRGGAGAAGDRAAMTRSVYRDQLAELDADVASGAMSREQFDAAKAEIERRVLEDLSADEAVSARGGGAWSRPVAASVGVAIPVLAVALYLHLGSPDALDIKGRAATAAANATHEVTPEQIVAMVARLAERLKEHPEDAEGWAMLARSYTALGRFQDATAAYAKAVEMVPDDAQLLADYADTLGMAQGRNLSGAPARLIQRALEADPNHRKALALAGTVAFNERNFSLAVEYWERLLRQVPPDSDAARQVSASIAEARAQGGLQAPSASVAAAPAPGASLSGTVRIDDKLAAKVAPGDTLFIFARAAEGPRMPLAIIRKPAAGLPMEFTLDESMGMAPNMRLSSFPQVVVGARISKSGTANPQSGDLEGLTAPIKVGAAGVVVTIDRIVP